MTCIDRTRCLSCIQGYKYSANTYVCSSTCSIGSYFNTTVNDCQSCSPSCLTCQSSTFCYICSPQTYLHILSTSTNQCIPQCPSLYYADTSKCMKCLYPCLECTSSIDCITCANGVLYQNRCIAGCPDSTYMSVVGNVSVCLACTGYCLTCGGTGDRCLSCVNGYYLVVGMYRCVPVCPSGTYKLDVTKSCVSCPDTCSACVNSSYCTACVANKTYLNTATHGCVEYCPTGTYGNSTSLQC